MWFWQWKKEAKSLAERFTQSETRWLSSLDALNRETARLRKETGEWQRAHVRAEADLAVSRASAANLSKIISESADAGKLILYLRQIDKLNQKLAEISKVLGMPAPPDAAPGPSSSKE